ncbi:MAG: hypothetical protein QGG64_05860, partial [Candidatus Latescibacteria bacterium]|nr:hypothetical protein [Candidatus Latescibacterota bacterium]
NRTFGSYRPRATRLLNMLPGYTSQAGVQLSAYGGWADRQVEGTGFFRTQKIDGRWWFVDPDGYLFFGTALNSIRWGSPKDRSVTAPPIFESRWSDPQAWAQETVGFLRTNGFNVVGTWSDPLLLKTEHKRPQVWTTVIYMMYPFGTRYGAKSNENNMQFPNKCIPIFDPEFEYFCRARAKEKITDEMIQDSTLLGYFVDNELPWREDALSRYLSLEQSDINFQKALAWVAKEKGRDARAVDIDTLKASLTDDEQDKFLRHIARRYFEIVSKVLRNRDPNHLFLGSRLHGQAIRLKPVFEVLGEYADVISVNYYHRWTPRTPELENWSTWSGDKPFVISEWYVKGEDSGYTNTDGAGGVVKTQVDRGRFYQNFTLGLLESKSCIGWFWHTYRDTKDLPNGSNKGFLSIRYEPFDDLVEMAREINTQVYPLTSYFDSQSRKN